MIRIGLCVSLSVSTALVSSGASEREKFESEVSAALQTADVDRLVHASCVTPPRAVLVETARKRARRRYAFVRPIGIADQLDNESHAGLPKTNDQTEYVIDLCIEPPFAKAICWIAPVKRRDGKLCID